MSNITRFLFLFSFNANPNFLPHHSFPFLLHLVFLNRFFFQLQNKSNKGGKNNHDMLPTTTKTNKMSWSPFSPLLFWIEKKKRKKKVREKRVVIVRLFVTIH